VKAALTSETKQILQKIAV